MSLNAIWANAEQETPAVGMGVTRLGYSDRAPGTIIEVKSDRTIVVQLDKATRTDSNGASESQTYDIVADPEGSTYILTKRKNNRWVERGNSSDGTAWGIGYRSAYHDYSF